MERAKGFEPSKRVQLVNLSISDEKRHFRTRLTRVDVVTYGVTTMASLRRLPNSPFWIACFTLPDGRRTNRSTGAKDKRQAQRVAAQFEDAAREARQGRFIETRARKAIADIFALANKDTLPSSTIEDFIESWLKRKELEAGEKTNVRNSGVMDDLREFLGARGKLDIAHLTAKEITKFRDTLAKRLTPGTVNVSLKVVRSA